MHLCAWACVRVCARAAEWRAEPAWEGGDLKLVKFVMLKENMDTQAALGVIARMLHCQPRSFGFAGTKDKRGVTTQWVTLWKVAPAKLAALNSRWAGVGCKLLLTLLAVLLSLSTFSLSVPLSVVGDLAQDGKLSTLRACAACHVMTKVSVSYGLSAGCWVCVSLEQPSVVWCPAVQGYEGYSVWLVLHLHPIAFMLTCRAMLADLRAVPTDLACCACCPVMLARLPQAAWHQAGQL